MLTSKANPKIKFLESLRKSRERKKHGLFLVEGEREISRAKHLKTLYYHEKNSLVSAIEEKGVELVQISKELLEKISLRGEMIAVGKMEKKGISSLKGKMFVALVGVEKPGNIGAILRTCDGCGIDGVLLVDPVTDHYHPNAIRSSLAASLTLDIVLCSSEEAFEFAAQKNLQLVTTSPDATDHYSKVDYTKPTMVAFGKEDTGLPESWLTATKVFIPMKGVCDSLNVSVSAGIVLYEALRQNECS